MSYIHIHSHPPMLSDNLLVNLKILSKIQKNGRISRSFDGIVTLETDGWYQPLKRFITNDSRKQAIHEINSITADTMSAVDNILNSKFLQNEYANSEMYYKLCDQLALLLHELENAKNGITNLKFTYQNDQNTVSQLDITLLKISTTLKDANGKLHALVNSVRPTESLDTFHDIPN